MCQAPEEKLSARGTPLPEVAAPVAAYVPAVVTGNYVYTSGQLPLANGELVAKGKVGADISEADAVKCAEVACLNALAAVRGVIGDLSRIKNVVKLTGFVASDPDFAGQPAVINGASLLLQEVLGEAGKHARSAVGVAALPLNAPVEVELVVEVA
ncbi:RidA family protein [Dermabacteraceae bacterium P7006]